MLAKRVEHVYQASFSISMSKRLYQETVGTTNLDKLELCSVKVSVRMCSRTTTIVVSISGVDMVRSTSSDELEKGFFMMRLSTRAEMMKACMQNMQIIIIFILSVSHSIAIPK